MTADIRKAPVGLAVSVLAVIMLSVPGLAQRPPTKTIEFTSGKFEAKLGDSSCAADLGHPGSELQFFQGGTQVLGAYYNGSRGSGCHQIRLRLTDLKGPGKYGKANIFNFSLDLDRGEVWNFNRQKDDCAFTFTKLDDTGVSGRVTCTGTGPVGTATLSAAR